MKRETTTNLVTNECIYNLNPLRVFYCKAN